MSRSLKAAFMSALLFPGTGHFYLGRWGRGLAFLLPTLAALAYIAPTVLGPALAIARDIMDGSMAFDPQLIRERLDREGNDGSLPLNLAALVMLVGWTGAAIDAWRVGRTAGAAH